MSCAAGLRARPIARENGREFGIGLMKRAERHHLKENELRICLKVFGKDRPAVFTSADGSSQALLVLKRANP